MRIILLGPPGSGKGTQGDLIAQEYGFPKISTGDLLREAVRDETSIGKKAKAAMNRGDLVNDDLVQKLLEERIAKQDCQKGYILDGFPRNIKQARMLEGMADQQAELVLDIRSSEERLIERLASRRLCSWCGKIYNLFVKAPDRPTICDACNAELIQRQDDMPDVIIERLKVYRKESEPLVEYYKKKKNYHRIEGDSDIKSVFQSIQTVLSGELAKLSQKEAVR